MRYLLSACFLLFATVLHAGPDMTARAGFAVYPTAKSHAELLEDLRAAVTENGMGLVTQAGPTGAAAARGIEIPGNTVVGVFNNDFAVKILALSTAAMIEAPVRFYVTENADGTATLSYKRPGFVFAPYADEGGAALETLAAALDARFAAIAAAATR
ncbi:hypothetical protein LA6_004625 [Marinibacterium anthonyi]|nr:hypothetical protein LA6_004625 [Marinibacterium anthonyi]